MVQPIRTVMSRMGSLQTGLAATERIFAMLNTPTESTDRARTDPGRLRSEVIFEDIHSQSSDQPENCLTAQRVLNSGRLTNVPT